MIVNLQSCEKPNQLWIYNKNGMLQPKTHRDLCLHTMAHAADQLRMPAELSEECVFDNALWNFTDDGLLRSMVRDGNAPHQQEGLCLAARSEGRFNYI
jgi:hypothetical protein